MRDENGVDMMKRMLAAVFFQVNEFYSRQGACSSKKSHLWDFAGCKIQGMADRLAKQLACFLLVEMVELTYKQFARKMGISDSTLHRMEMAEQNVTLKTLEQICYLVEVQRIGCVWGDRRSD